MLIVCRAFKVINELLVCWWTSASSDIGIILFRGREVTAGKKSTFARSLAMYSATVNIT